MDGLLHCVSKNDTDVVVAVVVVVVEMSII